jgi:hypothetical protein
MRRDTRFPEGTPALEFKGDIRRALRRGAVPGAGQVVKAKDIVAMTEDHKEGLQALKECRLPRFRFGLD